MKRKDIIFCLVIIILFFTIRRLPIDVLFHTGKFDAHAKDFKAIIMAIVITGGSYWVARKFNLTGKGGFSGHEKKNYWMLLLPLIFPGIMFGVNIEITCFDDFSAVLIFFSVFLFKGLVEETVFRGVIQGYLLKNYPKRSYHFSCFLSASLFAVCHLTNLEYTVSYNVIIQVIYAFFMGLLFSALLIRTNNVWLLGLVHGLLNSIVTGCETNNHLMSGTGTTSTFFEYVIQMLGVTLIFSPMLFVYWMLIKTIPKSYHN